MPHGRRRGGTESKNPVRTRRMSGPDRMLFRHSPGFFTAHRPTAKARANAAFRMTLYFDAMALEEMSTEARRTPVDRLSANADPLTKTLNQK